MGISDYSRFLKITFFSISFLVVLLILIELSVLTIFLFKKESLEEGNRDEFKEYQLLVLDKDSNEYSFGKVKIPRITEDFEFQEEERSFELISNFGETKYKCTGLCSCQLSTNSRRNSGSLASNGLLYLLVAVSSIAALKLATEYFNNECNQRLSETCPQEAIFSEVDNCEEVLYSEIASSSSSESKATSNQFWCEGSCVLQPESLEEFDGFHKCADHPGQCVREAIVAMGMNKLNAQHTNEDLPTLFDQSKEICNSISQEGLVEVPSAISSSFHALEEAKNIFRTITLIPECIEAMKYQVDRKIDDLGLAKREVEAFYDVMKQDPSQWSLCVGEYSDNTNPTISCRKHV